jgi:hypothetical protein
VIKRTKRELVLLGLGWCLLSATTPGAVGSCGTDELGRPAEFSSYCQMREELACTRRFLRKEITAETRDSCRWNAIDECARRAFPPDCQPTRRVTEACLRALASFDTLSTPESELRECQEKALCTATIQPLDAAVGGDAPDGAQNP